MTKRPHYRRHINPEYVFSEVELASLHSDIMNQAIPLGDTALKLWKMVMGRSSLTQADLSNLDAFKVPTIPEQQFVNTVTWIIERVRQQLPNHSQEDRDRAAVPLVFLWMQSVPPTHQHTSSVPTYNPPTPPEQD